MVTRGVSIEKSPNPHWLISWTYTAGDAPIQIKPFDGASG